MFPFQRKHSELYNILYQFSLSFQVAFPTPLHAYKFGFMELFQFSFHYKLFDKLEFVVDLHKTRLHFLVLHPPFPVL